MATREVPSEVTFQASAKAQRKSKAPESLYCTKASTPSLSSLPRHLPEVPDTVSVTVLLLQTQCRG